jgi:hypothetical protein
MGTRLPSSRRIALAGSPEQSSPCATPLSPTGPWLQEGYHVPLIPATTTRSASLAGTRGLHNSSPLIPRVFAGRERPRRPARPSLLWLPVSLRLPSCIHAGRPLACLRPITSASASAIAQSGALGISIPTVSLEHPPGLLVGRCFDAIGSPLATALEVACPPGLTDLDAPASGRRDLYTRACPQQGHPRRESGMTTAPNWAIAPAGPSPAGLGSVTGCTRTFTGWSTAVTGCAFWRRTGHDPARPSRP